MSHFTVLVIGPDPEKQLAPFQENNMGDCPQEFLRYRAYDKAGESSWHDTEDAAKVTLLDQFEEGYTENPNAKWDWYSLGGRWTGFFTLKTGCAGELGSPGLMTEAGETGTADQARKCDIIPDSIGSTFAVLKDGQWYERGKMGWWACVSNEKSDEEWKTEFAKLIAGLPDDTLLSLYDCHI